VPVLPRLTEDEGKIVLIHDESLIRASSRLIDDDFAAHASWLKQQKHPVKNVCLCLCTLQKKSM